MKTNHITLIALALMALSAQGLQAQPDLTFVTVGDPGNPPDSNGFGSVDWTFSITENRITNQQYADFLNAVDPEGTNQHELHHPSMNAQAIYLDQKSERGQRFRVVYGNGDKPATFVCWCDAARFANWLCNGGRPGSSTEYGAYNLRKSKGGPIARQLNAKFWVPCEDEIYKAAFYEPSGAWFRPKQLYTLITSSGAPRKDRGAIQLTLDGNKINEVVDAMAPIARPEPAGDQENYGDMPYLFVGADNPHVETPSVGFRIAHRGSVEDEEKRPDWLAELFDVGPAGGVSSPGQFFSGSSGGSGPGQTSSTVDLPPAS